MYAIKWFMRVFLSINHLSFQIGTLKNFSATNHKITNLLTRFHPYTSHYLEMKVCNRHWTTKYFLNDYVIVSHKFHRSVFKLNRQYIRAICNTCCRCIQTFTHFEIGDVCVCVCGVIKNFKWHVCFWKLSGTEERKIYGKIVWKRNGCGY